MQVDDAHIEIPGQVDFRYASWIKNKNSYYISLRIALITKYKYLSKICKKNIFLKLDGILESVYCNVFDTFYFNVGPFDALKQKVMIFALLKETLK